jgi:hypothetical protein
MLHVERKWLNDACEVQFLVISYWGSDELNSGNNFYKHLWQMVRVSEIFPHYIERIRLNRRQNIKS